MNQKSPQPSSSQNKCEDGGADNAQVTGLPGNEDTLSSKNPLKMNEILDMVLSHCDVPTLKTARLVSKLWNSEAIRKLYQAAYFTVPPKFYSKTKKEQQFEVAHMKKFLSTHHLFLPNVQAVYRRDLPILNDFGKPGSNPCIGPFVTHLKLGYGLYDSMKDLKELFHRMKNLKVLDTHPSEREESLEDEEPGAGNFCRNLIKICAKLYPRVITLTDFRMIFNLIGEQIDDLYYIDKMKKFSTMSNVRIQEFIFAVLPCPSYNPETWVKLCEILSTMLERSKDDMTSIILRGCEMFLRDTRVPTMSRLQRFTWSVRPPCRCQDNYYFPPKYSFPPGFQFSANFPNMNKMDILYDTTCDENEANGPQFWESYFADQKPAPSLKRLGYCDEASDFNLEPILRCFPKLEEFELSRPGDFSLAAKSIFTYGKNLKTLKLNINLDDLISTTSSFDEIFTGFSSTTVLKIRSRSKDWDVKEMLEEWMTVNSLRVQPSLLDLPRLELLNIKFVGDKNESIAVKTLFVAGKYAFSLLPKLQVNIDTTKCSKKKRLKLVLKDVSEIPNVTIN